MKKLRGLFLGLANMAIVFAVAAAVDTLGRRVLRVPEVAMGLALLPLYFAGSRWVERREPADLYPTDSARCLGGGIALGITLFSCLMGILWFAGVYLPTSWGSWRPLAMALLSAFTGAVIEEMLFRGFLFRLIAALSGKWSALIVTSALFGVAHLSKPGATLTNCLTLGMEAGVLLGAAYASSGSLWLPIGIHTGWNFAEGPVFGMEVSGNVQRATWIQGELHGPVILTGGSFGPEASIFAALVCIVPIVIYLRKLLIQKACKQI